jgi:hypothetical protein
MRLNSLVVIAILAAGSVPGACAQHGLHGESEAAKAPPASQGETVSLQGDQSAWINNPHMRGFYDLTKATLGANAEAVNVDAYRDASYVIFRAFAASMGTSPDGMVEHLKDIPRQMVNIVRDDPKVLDSYDSFVVALMGPQ